MNAVGSSDALDSTKENIRPLRQGRKPVQLETALQAQSNMEVQQKLNKEKEQFEHAIRTYEGDDPLALRFEYIKWLEQIYFKQGPECNILPLIEETVQKFKDNEKYKQDQRFIKILINFIENQSNALELYQTVYNQGLGTMCASFYRAWADLLEGCGDFKRVDQIYLLGIKNKAEPINELEQAHLQFQLSIARRMLNGQLSNEDEDKNSELGKRQAFNVLKESETTSGMRHGLGGLVGKAPLLNKINGKVATLRVFEDNDENGIFGSDSNNINDLAPKGLNKENTVNPGPWTEPKKSRVKVPVPVSTINFEVHQDNNKESVTKLTCITVPNALRSIKGSSTVSCPVALFEPPNPNTKAMYCKDKVYAAGRDVQIEEIRYEIYLKQQKDKYSIKEKEENTPKSLEKVIPPKKLMPPKKLVLPEDNLKSVDFKVPLPQQMESDPLSQSVTVNTRAAIDLVQQMWNSPKADEEPELYRNEVHVQVYENDNNDDQMKKIQMPEVYIDEIDDNQVKSSKIPKVYIEEPEENKERDFKIPHVFGIFNGEKESKKMDFKRKADQTHAIKPFQRQPNKIKNYEVNEDENKTNINQDENEIKVYQDENNIKVNQGEKNQNKDSKTNIQVNACEDPAHPITENKSPFKHIQNIEVTDDDLTCSTKAFAFLLSSSTPLAPTGSKSKSVIKKKEALSLDLSEEKEVKEVEEFQLGKSLSMILEASKERNSSTSSGIISTTYSSTKLSTIDFGDSINPFDAELIATLLNKAINFPKKHHMQGYLKYKSDLPNIRTEFKLGNNKMTFLNELGKGAYARVIKARVDDKNGTEMALKIQKPACTWEWYISKEIQQRLKDSEKVSYFINMENMYVFKNGSIISMEYATHGTLLSVVLAYKNALNRSIPVTIAAQLTCQITSAVKYLHQCQIIHGDLKPDNVIIKSLPNRDSQPCVQLIDFGRSIDMTLFPPNTSFIYSVKTADFICHEMREKLPWTYQTDYFGLAGIIYMILMSDYMKTQKIRKVWVLLKPFPRYIDKQLWDSILNKLLNVESCEKLPNLDEIIGQLDKYLSLEKKVVISHDLTSFKNVLNKR